jgi:outer membrane receptor for ferrienterochelin and colicin
MSLGRYFRMPAYTSLGYKENGDFVNRQNDIRYIQSDHAILGIEYIPRDDMIFTLEGFYKGYDYYPVSVKDSVPLATKGAADFGVIGNEEITSDGEGRAYGFEVMNRIKTGNWLNFILSYTFVRSEFIGNNGEWAPSSWDSRHIISTTATVNFGKNWSAGAKWRYSGGLPYTPYDLEYSSIKDAWDINGGPYSDYSEVNTLRFSSFNQLDIRIDKRFFFPKWSLMLYLDIQNLFNQKAEQRPYVVREKDANGEYILVNDGANYVLRTIDSTTGTVLPTFGIMVEF